MSNVTGGQIAAARMATVAAIVIWFSAAAFAGFLGWVNEPGRPPVVLASFVFVPILTFLTAYASSRPFRAFTDRISLALLVGSNIWRFVGIGFVYGWLTGRLAAGFALPAGIGDIIVAVGCVALLPSLLRGARPRGWLLIWNWIGLADLIAAIVLGMLYSNSAVGALGAGTPTTAWMVGFPISLVPTFFVPLFILVHLLIFRRLAGPSGAMPRVMG
jgi:hypothetical protein